MIDHISINNFAIIENTEIDFEKGLNVITGETGAGKSIVIEAVSLALGSRADSSFVRTGADKAIIQLAATIDGMDHVITREISAGGKNLCKIDGQLVTLGEVSALARKIADIHGQYDNQTLLDPLGQLELVDKYHMAGIMPRKADFVQCYEVYKTARSKLNDLLSKESENKRKLDFYKYEVEEIDKADMQVNEDEELSDRISVLQNSEKIFDAIENAYTLLDGDEGNILSLMAMAQQSLESIQDYSRDLTEIGSGFSDLYYNLQDMAKAIGDVRDSTSFTPGELDSAIARLDTIDKLKKKYGQTIDEVLAYRDRIASELTQIENFDEIKGELESGCHSALSALKAASTDLSKARISSAAELSDAIETELHDLNFDDAHLEIQIKPAPAIGPDGGDLCEIMMTTNKGEPLRPLTKIASGGEISRIMLAIKNVTGTYDKVPTMIFDEIDAGISGVTASIVGRKLKQISGSHQIICITHLPQIAAAGSVNYRIFKDSDESSTYTHVEKLDCNEKIQEIARLLGGDRVTDTTIKSAEELIERS